ncbi:hypothetical protein A3A55_01215 [Candidatus Roizmanbacteria bacterium RIFCSPLOWO2_01_FULL_40_14]|nr:MAG: hypothetical protein A3A55_01215 [Candidatus Roizmanbacteria bacterium RIFCSPLOWO2_01_FULL_40_14]
MDKDLEKRMFNVFYKTLADLRTEKQVEMFLHDLLTPTEKVMLAKRLAIAILLIKDLSYRYIRDMLKVSTTTIVSTNMWLNQGGDGYRAAIEKLIREEKADELLDNVDEIVSNIIPPRRGTDWSKVRSEQWKQRMKRKADRRL